MDLLTLIRKCKADDTPSQSALYHMLKNSMYMYCRRLIHTQHEAQEIMSEGFLVMFKKIYKFEYSTDAAFVSWLQSIMRIECLAAMRKQKNNLVIVDEVTEEPGYIDEAMNRLEIKDFYKFLAMLPTMCGDVFNLFVLEGYTHKQIAQELNISEVYSKTLLNKAKASLQFLMQQNDIRYGSGKP